MDLATILAQLKAANALVEAAKKKTEEANAK